MDFRLELKIKPFKKLINIQDKMMLIGSCFTEHMSKQLQKHKFCVLENPNGILFNPASIANAIKSYAEEKQYVKEDLFLHNGLWTSWEHHSLFSDPDADKALLKINNAITSANRFLHSANWLIVTLGSSFVYELKDNSLNGKPGAVAANCHKVPQQHFNHRLLTYPEVENYVNEIARIGRQANPNLKIILTISPVRHSREGLVENNRSKALLHSAVHQITESLDDVFYFPAYELMIDDLRDYRFYAEDMVHPNYQATQYVWEKFSEAVIDLDSRSIMKELLSIHQAKNHRPLHEGSQQHQAFLTSMYHRVKKLQEENQFLNLREELEYFGKEAT